MTQLVGMGPQKRLSSEAATVVPHHEPMAGRNDDRLPESARIAAAAGRNVGVLLPDAVADDVAAHDRDPVAGAADDPLDERLARLIGGRLIARLLVPSPLVRLPQIGFVVGSAPFGG